MKKMIAYCGLSCNSCPIHLATREENPYQKRKLKQSIAELCTKQYGMILNPEDVNDCDGCRADTGRLFSGCLNCEIRKCAIRKQLESCAFCHEYICDKLEKHFLLDPHAKEMLDKIRQQEEQGTGGSWQNL